MKVDSAGNVYCGGSGGIWILDAKGKKLGRIVHGQPQTTNLTNWNFLGSRSPARRYRRSKRPRRY
jgi:sugar lactone lactonase YvrE